MSDLPPIHKRWPGQYAFRLKVWLPSGGHLTIDTSLPHDEAKKVVTQFVDAVAGRTTGRGIVEVIRRKRATKGAP